MPRDQKKFKKILEGLRSGRLEKELNYTEEAINSDGTIRLFEKELSYTEEAINNEDAFKLSQAIAVENLLKTLDLSWNKVGNEGALYLAGSTLFSLSLMKNLIGPDGAKALSKSKTLKTLNLSTNKVGAEGARSLAENAVLTCLNLHDNQIGDNGVKPFSTNKMLIELDLSMNQIGFKGAKYLALNSNISCLNLSDNHIEKKGIDVLMTNQTLLSLNLSHNQLGDTEAESLAANQTLSNLILHVNNISDKGAKALAANHTLTALDLSNNNITDIGAQYFLANRSLTILDLHKDYSPINISIDRQIKANLERNRERANEFLDACWEGHLTKVKDLLSTRQVSPYVIRRSYNTYLPKNTDSLNTGLHLAVLNKQREIILYFMEHYPHLLHFRDKNNQTVLMLLENEEAKETMEIVKRSRSIATSSLPANVPSDKEIKEQVISPPQPLPRASMSSEGTRKYTLNSSFIFPPTQKTVNPLAFITPFAFSNTMPAQRLSDTSTSSEKTETPKVNPSFIFPATEKSVSPLTFMMDSTRDMSSSVESSKEETEKLKTASSSSSDLNENNPFHPCYIPPIVEEREVFEPEETVFSQSSFISFNHLTSLSKNNPFSSCYVPPIIEEHEFSKIEEKSEEINYKIPHENLHVDINNLDNFLGQGGFGKVFKGLYQSVSVAVKQLLIFDSSDRTIIEFKQEAEMMSRLDHPHIVHFYGMTESSPYRLVMELMSQGSLFKVLRSQAEISWQQRQQWATEVGRGLHYLHQHQPQILHRDLKSMNILVGEENILKLTDFGLAVMNLRSITKTLTTHDLKAEKAVGSLRWMAPELLSLKPKYSRASDVFAFAIVMWELVSRALPYKYVSSDSTIEACVKRGEREEIPETCPVFFAKLITQCWAQEPKDRLSVMDVVNQLQSPQDRKGKAPAFSAALAMSVSRGYASNSTDNSAEASASNSPFATRGYQ